MALMLERWMLKNNEALFAGLAGTGTNRRRARMFPPGGARNCHSGRSARRQQGHREKPLFYHRQAGLSLLRNPAKNLSNTRCGSLRTS